MARSRCRFDPWCASGPRLSGVPGPDLGVNALDALYFALGGITAPVWARKARGGWPERFGRIEPLPSGADPTRPRLLLHSVSVGETSALRHLVPLLTPHADVVISASTDTGLARASDLYARSCTVVRYPLDFSWAVRRFLDAVRPDAVALVELELWPNFIRACGQRGIPIGVINGRLSARSFKGYRKIRRFIGPSFAALDFAAVQDTDYQQRFLHMGVRPDRCSVTGSMKWDAASIADTVPGADQLAVELGIDRSRPLIVAGSTGPGEEALLHAACPPGVQLLCAPRKPERFDEAAAAMPGSRRRSRPAQTPGATDRFLLDTIGELRMAYALADVVVVGRSFGTQFGSDPIEPIALGKPTVIGPAVSDFQAIVEAFLAARGILQATAAALPAALAELVASPALGRELAARGRACIAANQGASRRHADLLLSVAGRRSPRGAR
ncbi:MAG: 3-deoxy-D-manno-octulosonic acid transferase [Phycisphaerales bacterium]|nr:3-deoxy-D-manno-octulosonic acid transferase [Phycisphaerales bacterium]